MKNNKLDKFKASKNEKKSIIYQAVENPLSQRIIDSKIANIIPEKQIKKSTKTPKGGSTQLKLPDLQ